MRGLVPDSILDRHDKLGFQTPQGRWLESDHSEWVLEKLDQANTVLQGRVSDTIVQKYQTLSNGRIGEWGEARHLFRLMTLGECIHQMNNIPRYANAPVAACC